MFKKFDPGFSQQARPLNSSTERLARPLTSEIVHALDEQEELDIEETPETVIAQGVSIKGTLSFQRLVRIDGHFEGELVSSGKVIIGPTGSIKANINLDEAFISGEVIGDITVRKRLVLRGRAKVRGDITAPMLSVDEGVSIIGILNIAQAETTAGACVDDDPYSSDN